MSEVRAGECARYVRHAHMNTSSLSSILSACVRPILHTLQRDGWRGNRHIGPCHAGQMVRIHTHTPRRLAIPMNHTLQKKGESANKKERKTPHPSHDINLPDIALPPLISCQAAHWIPDPPLLRSNLFIKDA